MAEEINLYVWLAVNITGLRFRLFIPLELCLCVCVTLKHFPSAVVTCTLRWGESLPVDHWWHGENKTYLYLQQYCLSVGPQWNLKFPMLGNSSGVKALLIFQIWSAQILSKVLVELLPPKVGSRGNRPQEGGRALGLGWAMAGDHWSVNRPRPMSLRGVTLAGRRSSPRRWRWISSWRCLLLNLMTWVQALGTHVGEGENRCP